MLCGTPMPLDRERRLSKHFVLREFLVDATFPEMAEQLEPDEKTLANLERLTALIDRVVDQFPSKWKILSGFRDHRLNEACRGAGMPASIESLHLSGCAADLQPGDKQVDLEAVFEWISEQSRRDLPIHEAVYYPMKGFIHVAVENREKHTPRRILLRT